MAHIVTSVSTSSAKPVRAPQSAMSDQVVPCFNRFHPYILNIIETNCPSANLFEMDASTSSAKPDRVPQGAASVLIIIHIEKIWSLVKGNESICTLSFFFFLLGNRIVLFFHNSNIIRLIYSGVLQGAQFCLFWVAVLAYSAYSEIAKSSPPLVDLRWFITMNFNIVIYLKRMNILRKGDFLFVCFFYRGGGGGGG